MRAIDMPPGRHVPAHRHAWGQLVYAVEGTVAVETAAGSWLVPPQRAVWVPPRIDHAVTATAGAAAFRSLYIDSETKTGLPDAPCVLEVEPLLRELIRAASDIPPDYPADGPEARLMAVVLDRLAAARPAPLHLPLPRDPRLDRVCAALIRDPADSRGLDAFAAEAGASARTLARLFQAELGLSFRVWRTRRRLLAAIERIAEGASVTAVAFALGYESPSAFVAMFRRETGTTPGRYMVIDDGLETRDES